MSSGEIFSPNYPDGYDSGLSCVWRISVTPGEKIVVRFRSLEVFNRLAKSNFPKVLHVIK